MKYCANCGNQLDDNSKFCPLCGSRQPELVKYVSNDNKKIVNNMGLKEITSDKIFSDDADDNDNSFEKEKTNYKKSVLDIFKIVLKIAGVCVLAFFLFAIGITAYTETQFDKLQEYLEECNYDEADEILDRLSGGVFQLFMGGDMLTLFIESNNQAYAEQYICEAFSEYKERYLDNSYILNATFYYQKKDISELEDKNGQTGQNSELDAQIDEITENLEKAGSGYAEYMKENKDNLFIEPESLVLIIEYGDYAVNTSGYLVFTYDMYDNYILFDTCTNLDEDAGTLQKWLSYCLNNEIYNTDYDRLMDMADNGAFN